MDPVLFDSDFEDLMSDHLAKFYGTGKGSDSLDRKKSNSSMTKLNILNKDDSCAVVRQEKSVMPRFNVQENEDEFLVRVEHPGIPKEKVKIDYDQTRNVLSISSSNEEQHEESKA
ncbi:MAG: hypothetical protein EZS28_024976, partial [Streblomastix strix]